MTAQNHSYLKIFWELIKTDLYVYKQTIFDAFVDASIWFACVVVTFSYVFPMIGMTDEFGVLIAVGAIFSCSFWDTWSTGTIFVSDIEGNKTINYFLTLPMSNTLVLIKQIVGYAIKAGIPTLIILPLGKLFLWKQMSLANFSIFKFAFFYVLMNIFVGSFSLFMTSIVKGLHHMGKVHMRFLFPLWFFGGSNYSWQMLNKLAPKISYVCLANPLIYAMEGIRVAVLGQEGYLPYWTCVLALAGFTILFSWIGIVRLKKRLDFV